MKTLTDDPRYLRDLNSSAILCKDVKSLEKHRNKVKQMNSLKNDTKEINNLKQEVAELKEIMNQILDHLNKENNGNI